MLSVLLSFLVIGILTAAAGAGTLGLVLCFCGTNLERYGKMSLTDLSMAGVAAAAVYAECWSIFGGVGSAAFFSFGMLAMVAGLRYRRYIASCFQSSAGRNSANGLPAAGFAKKRGIFKFAVYVCIFLLCAMAASGGYPHFDTDLYHAQSIRWIEEYGAVKGLANLHNRLGYNSAAFALTALFSGSFALPQSLHTVSGYLSALVLGKCLWGLVGFAETVQDGFDVKRRQTLILTVFIRLAGIWYTCNVLKEIGSPSSDSFMVLITVFIVLRSMEELGNQREALSLNEHCCMALSLLSLLCVFNVTIKLSCAGLLLIALCPAVILLRVKAWRKIAALIAVGGIIVLPFLVRNVILSGYLVYPFPGLDLFQAVWKVPYGAALADAREITAWGKGVREVALAEAPLSVWFLPWFHSQGKLDQIMFLAAAVPALPAVVMLAWKLIRTIRNKRDVGQLLFIELVLLTAFLFWFTNSPLMRYGCIFCYLLAFFHTGMLYVYIVSVVHSVRPKKVLCRFAALLTALLVGYKLGGALRQQAAFLDDFHPIWQKDYGTYETDSYLLDGVMIYYPTNGNQAGYAAFPSSPTVRAGQIRLLGDDISDGFAAVE